MYVDRWNALRSTESRPVDASHGGKRGVSIYGISSLNAYYHQQYLAKNPDGYCRIGGCGVPFKVAELQVGEKA